MSSRGAIRVIRPANIVTTVSARSTISSSSVCEDDAGARRRRMADEVVNIGPPADVDPASRFVEPQQSDILFFKAASEEDLLLVAAAECFRRSA